MGRRNREVGGMKGSEIRMCDGCGEALIKHPMANFYVVTSSPAMIDRAAFNQTQGLAMMFGGNLAIAEAMSPDADIVKVLGEAMPALMTKLLICFDCYTCKPLAGIAERVSK
jgi:hypothetical protein